MTKGEGREGQKDGGANDDNTTMYLGIDRGTARKLIAAQQNLM